MPSLRHALRRTVLVTVLAGPLLSHAALAQEDTATTSLEARLDELDQKIRILERVRELAADSAAQAGKTRPSVSAGAGGFSLKSADGSFQIRFRGYIQADARFYRDDTMPLTDLFLIRRARLVLEATMYGYFDFRLMPDFGGSAIALYDAYGEIRVRPEFALRVGKFKAPIGLERLQSATDTRFDERGLPTNLVPTRDLGLQLGGELARGVISYQAGVFNGVPDLGNGDAELTDRKDLVGRLFLLPFARQAAQATWDLGLGIAASTGGETGTPTGASGLPSYRSPGQITVFKYRSSSTTPATGTVYADGDRFRLNPQAYLNHGSIGLQGEYVISRSAVSRDTGAARTSIKLKHSAWQVAGSWFLTGEKASYRTVTPRRPFDPAGHAWGGLELVARYGEIHFDPAAFAGNRFADSAASIRSARAWALGLNWHLARNYRIGIDFERTTFDGGGVTGHRPDEKFLVTRLQAAL